MSTIELGTPRVWERSEQIEREDWREAAMRAALDTEARDGNAEDTLTRAILERCPGASTAVAWTDRDRLLRFMREEAGGYRSVVAGRHTIFSSDEDGTSCIYLGWYSTEWNGTSIEVAFAPSACDAGDVVFFAFDAEALNGFVREAVLYAGRPQGRCLRYSRAWDSSPRMDEEIGRVTWDDIILPPATLAGIREAVEGFGACRAAFEAFGFAWRRGILLIGPPGTGKTLVCKAAAAALPDMPFLYVRDISERCQKDTIREIFERARALSPCILAFEDMDGFITNQNRTVFLNELDGFNNNHGLLIIASSNHPDKIDEALLKRPSRFDRVFHLGTAGPDERRRYCLTVLTRPELAKRIAPAVDVDGLARRVAERTHGFTPAYLKEALSSAVLQFVQQGVTVLDERFADAVLSQVESLRQHLRRANDPDALTELSSADGAIGIRRWQS